MAESKKITLQEIVKAFIDESQRGQHSGFGLKFLDYLLYHEQNHSLLKGMPESAVALAKAIDGLEKNSPESQDVNRMIRFVYGIYGGEIYVSLDDNDKRLFINKVKSFDDKKLIYDAFSLFIQRLTGTLSREVSTILANSEYATISDIYRQIQLTRDVEELKQLVKDLFKMADAALEVEMSKELPDKGVVEQICTTVLGACVNKGIVEEMQIAREKYDVTKIFAIAPESYIAKYEESASMRIGKIQEENYSLRKQNESLLKEKQSVMDAAARTKDAYDKKLQYAEEKLSVLEGEKSGQLSTIKAQEKRIQLLEGQLHMLQELAANVRGGIGGRGVKELHALVDEISGHQI